MKKVLIGLVIAVMMTGSGYAKDTIYWNAMDFFEAELAKGLAEKDIDSAMDEIEVEYRKLCNESIHKGERLMEYDNGTVSFHYKDHIFIVMTRILNFNKTESRCYVSKF